jgi:hypothetical protein
MSAPTGRHGAECSNQHERRVDACTTHSRVFGRARSAGRLIAGMRSWICVISSFDGTVMTVNVRPHSPVAGSFQFSHSPRDRTGPHSSSRRHKLACRRWSPAIQRGHHRHNAAAPSVGIEEHRPRPHRLRHGVVRLWPALRVVNSRRNETPLEQTARRSHGSRGRQSIPGPGRR